VKERVRVLVVDDSAFARKALRSVLASSPEIDVVGIARDGLEALERIAELKPDVITLDLVMPNLDGLGLLRALPASDAPRVVVVTSTDASSDLAIQALQLGAVDLVQKPTALATHQLYELNDELIMKVLQAGRARQPSRHWPSPSQPRITPVARHARIVVIGASTGGPSAITQLLSALPKSFPIPIVVALHIPAGYTDTLAARINDLSQLEVVEARDGLALRPGLAVLARGGEHVVVRMQAGSLCVSVTQDPIDAPYFPSVDLLFESAVRAVGGALLGVVLTGMGQDGKKGAGIIRRAGGTVLTEAESSCVIYGMPRSVVEAGFSSAAVPLERLPESILIHL
jgi:two-component system, chemotaxis family, protein-glutamate methylesterase/glutaminase